MSVEEERLLRKRATPYSLNFPDMKELGGMLLSVGGMYAVFVVIAWLILAWVVRLIFDVDYGWNHPNRMTILLALVALSVAYTSYQVIKKSRPGTDERDKLLKDIENGVVEVLDIEVREAKVLQEPEHGGLFYFLRTHDDEVFVMFDYESQDLGANGEDPFASSFSPKEKLQIARTPIARSPVSEEFSGKPLDVRETLDMTAHPDKWPEPEQFDDVAWSEIESVYTS